MTVLRQISAQLASFSVNSQFINSTHAFDPFVAMDHRHPFQVPPSAVWVNSLWFSSLVCSLASASIALVVKQWLHQATMGLSGASRDIARMRQHRLNSLHKWGIGAIVAALPILLLVALALFLIGVIILLWSLHNTVAIITSSLVGTLFALFVVVTIMPLLHWDCCYRSPQAHAVYEVIRLTFNTLKQAMKRFFRMLWKIHVRVVGRKDLEALLHRIEVRVHDVGEIPTWDGRDHSVITKSTGELDRCLATTAYTATLSTSYLDRLHVILPDLPLDQLNPALEDIWSTCSKHFGGPVSPSYYVWHGTVQRAELSALYALRHMLTVPPARRDSRWRLSTMSIMEKMVNDIEGPPHCNMELLVSTLGPLSLDNHDLAWRASDRVMSFWLYSQKAEHEGATYAVIRGGKRSSSAYSS